MISALASALRPLYLPILQLRLEAPVLPEGTRSVRHLKPGASYLAYRYLEVGAVLAICLPGLALIMGALAHRKGSAGVVLAIAALLAFLFFAGGALVVVRMDWELRDYLIGDRSLRLRQGALVQQEVTLSFANIQNVEVTQGPLERLFGFQNLKVSTAGGSMPNPGQAHSGMAGHGAMLVGLEDAEAIRDVMLAELRRHRGAGLGDPDDSRPHPTPVLQEVLEAAKALRLAAETRGARGGS